MSKCIVSGSFDPLTDGHVHLIEQAAELFDEVNIIVSENSKKKYLLSDEEREEAVYDYFWQKDCIGTIKLSDELVVDVARRWSCPWIVRGVRDMSDMAYEQNLSDINFELSGGYCRTIFIPADPQYKNISSSLVKELYSRDKEIARYVPAHVAMMLRKLKNK